jgi:glycosyltransferase involved in cell wall biosynthesis
LRKFIESEQIDVVHFNSSNSLFGAIGAKQAKNKPETVFTFHGLSVLDPNYKSFFKIFYWLIFKFLLMFVDKAVFVSKNNLDYATRTGLVKNGDVVYNGLDLKDADFLTKDEARKFLSSKTDTNLNNKFIIGSIGRLAYPKNYEFLIQAFPDILKAKPDAIGIIIGEGPERTKYESLIKELGLSDKVKLAGEVKDAYRYLRAFDVFVLPSIYEGLSISLIETLIAGVPALASNVGGNAEILGEKNVYPSGAKKEFIEKLKNIRLSADKSKEFSTEKMVQKYLEIYKNVSKD